MRTNGRAAYGPVAERLALSFDPGDPVVVFDHTGAAEALLDCAARRFRGETFFVRALLQPAYALRAEAVVPTILSTFATLDDRMVALDQAFTGALRVNGALLADVPAYTAENLRIMQATLRLADALVTSSCAEHRRVTEMLLTDPANTVMKLTCPSTPTLSSAHSMERDAVVIWAPHLNGEIGAAFALVLEELRLPLLLVTDTEPVQPSRATWIAPSDARHALARARVILCTNAYASDEAIALATWGAPLVADAESGANEVLAGVRVFDRRRVASIYEAVVSALGAAPPTERSPETQAARLCSPAAQLLQDGPLVSVVIPTLDRPAMLRDALKSIQAQTYRNIETIVVVDGGPRLDALALEFPNVSFVHMPENNPLHSSNTAFSRTSGKYVTFLNDDDVYFPDHVAALVTALTRSGGSVAHGDVLTAFLRGEQGDWKLYGFESNMSRATSFGGFLVSNLIGMTSCMFRRDCIADGVCFEEAVPLYRDYALWVRLATDYDFIHVERLTSCYTIRNDGAQQQSNQFYHQALRSYEVLYERNSVKDRPALERQRAIVLQSVVDERMRLRPQPAAEVAPVTWPLWDS